MHAKKGKILMFRTQPYEFSLFQYSFDHLRCVIAPKCRKSDGLIG